MSADVLDTRLAIRASLRLEEGMSHARPAHHPLPRDRRTEGMALGSRVLAELAEGQAYRRVFWQDAPELIRSQTSLRRAASPTRGTLSIEQWQTWLCRTAHLRELPSGSLCFLACPVSELRDYQP